MNVPGWLLTQTASIYPPEGQTAHGVQYEQAPVIVDCYAEPRRRKVRDRNGAEIISNTTVILPAGTSCPTGSLVTVGDVTGEVADLDDVSAPGLPTPDHVEIALI